MNPAPSDPNRIPGVPLGVVVLGATGSVGQRFIQLLADHPWFKIVGLTGSDRTVGQPYGQACKWVLSEPMPARVRDIIVQPTDPALFPQARIAFSALPADLARDKEPAFARAGLAVCSNASAYRQEEDVPLLLPEVNPDHLKLIPFQRQERGWPGCIVTNPNCTSTGLTVALKALQNAFGVRRIFAVSMQALSGAGYPGVASLDILDNVIPWIGGEEEKVEWEPRKMLGTFQQDRVTLADCVISAHTNRVAVSDGHLVTVSLELERRPSPEEAIQVLRAYQPPTASLGLPSTPDPILLVRDEPDRPQPRLDRMTGNGMSTVVGRVRADSIFDLKFAVLSHNTIRGAAGGSIYNAELLVQEGFVS